MQVIYLENNIENFTTEDGRECSPIAYNNGFILPLGWEIELQNREITYTIIEYKAPIEDE